MDCTEIDPSLRVMEFVPPSAVIEPFEVKVESVAVRRIVLVPKVAFTPPVVRVEAVAVLGAFSPILMLLILPVLVVMLPATLMVALPAVRLLVLVPLPLPVAEMSLRLSSRVLAVMLLVAVPPPETLMVVRAFSEPIAIVPSRDVMLLVPALVEIFPLMVLVLFASWKVISLVLEAASMLPVIVAVVAVSYTHLRAHET